MKDRSNGYSALFLLLLCAVGLYGTLTTPAPMEEELVGPMVLPWLSLGGCFLCALLLLVRHFFTSKVMEEKLDTKAIAKSICYFIFFAAYLMLMIFIGDVFLQNDELIVPYGGGFSIATFLFLTVSLYTLGRRNWFEILGIPAGIVGLLLIVFGHYFSIILP